MTHYRRLHLAVCYNAFMKLDRLTKQAIEHTLHCLIGCGIGEIVGMLISSAFGWHRLGRLPLAIILAFLFGYWLTYRGVRKNVSSSKEAFKITAATDTVSIATMELVDNTIELIIPNALLVTATQARFWWGLALSLSIAFLITVLVNRYMISKNPYQHMH
jgi:Zn-dependent protease